MNTKIEELALRAGMEDYPTRGVNTLYGDKEIEIFALLILQECQDVMMGESNSNKDMCIKLNHHFGINQD